MDVHAETRAHRILIHQLIVVPAQVRADCPVAEPDEILHKRGLFETRTIFREVIGGRSAGMEFRRLALFPIG
jgi:hypothetical protein